MSARRVVLAAASSALCAAALAQTDLTPYLNSPFNGTLAPGDQTLQSGEYQDSFTFPVRQGDRVEMTMRSSQLDPYLIYVSPGGNQVDNDDGAGGTDALISIIADANGFATVRATTYRPGETGAYTLRVDVRPGGGSPGVPPPPSSGGSDRLGPGDQTLQTGEYVDVHHFTLIQGRTYDISATSSQFDTYLIYVSPGGNQIDDDDSGGGTNAALTVVADRTGDARVSVTSYRPGETGAYSLTVTER